MATESELIQARDDAQKALDDFWARPAHKVYLNMPVIVNGQKLYASHFGDDDGLLFYFDRGRNSHTNTDHNLLYVCNWSPDYGRPSLFSWRPVDETIPEHNKWLVKNKFNIQFSVEAHKTSLIFYYTGCKCLPLYEKDK